MLDNGQKKPALYRYNEYALILLTGLALIFLLGGLVLYLLGPVKNIQAVPLKDIIDGLARIDPSSIIAAGIATLLVLPLVLMVISIMIFIWKREWMLALASFAVLVFLSASIFLAIK